MKEYEQLISLLQAKITELESIINSQARKIAELEKRLKKNSRNSSNPPSSDALSRPPRTSSLREKGNNKSGGQPGHKGETLKQVDTPDLIKNHPLEICPDCQHSIGSSPVIKVNTMNPDWQDLYKGLF